MALAHLVAPAIPLVEVAYHRDALGARRPDREMRAFHAFVPAHMGADPAVELAMGALDEQVVVDIAENSAVGVGVVENPLSPGIPRLEPIAEALAPRRQKPFEKAVLVARLEHHERSPALVDNLEGLGMRHERANDQAVGCHVGPEDGEGIAVSSRHDCRDVAVARAPPCFRHTFRPSISAVLLTPIESF